MFNMFPDGDTPGLYVYGVNEFRSLQKYLEQYKGVFSEKTKENFMSK
jgi:hypothetical protein